MIDECHRCGRETELHTVHELPWAEDICADGQCDEDEISSRAEAAYERSLESYYGGDSPTERDMNQPGMIMRMLREAGRR